MTHRAHGAFTRIIVTFGIVAFAGAGLAFGLATDEDLDPAVRDGIEKALSAKVGELLNEKNEQGEPYKRGIYSRSFHKVDDSTYRVGFHIDTALDTDLITERYLFTVKDSGNGNWSIVDEELQDTYKGLHRGVLGDEQCFRFDKFSFDREGLRVTATNGSMCQDFYLDKVSRFSLSSDDLAYEYIPPIAQDQVLFEIFKHDRGKDKDVVFDPQWVSISCDPVTCEELIQSTFTNLQSESESETHPDLQDAYKEYTRRSQDEMKGNPFWGFRRPIEDSRRVFNVRIRKAGGGDHDIALDYDNFEGQEITFSVDGLGGTVLGQEFLSPLFSYHAEATRKSGISPDDLERRPDSDARNYDLQSLVGTVEMGFGDGETIVGDVTYKLTTKRKMKEIPFFISRLNLTDSGQETRNPAMTINSLQDGDGNEMTWVRTGIVSGLAVLPEEVPAGTPITLRLQFENSDLLYKLTPAFSYVDRFGWLPFVRFGDLIHEFDLTIKVPARYKTLGIGEKIADKTEGGVNTTRWVSNSPVAFASVIFGQYHEAESSFDAKKSDGTVIPVTMHVDKDSMASWGMSPRALKKFADDAANALNLYRDILGVDYPYDKLDLVNDPAPAFYAQAPSSLIYVGSTAFTSTGRLGSSDNPYAGARLTQAADSIIAHEVAHQWWGSAITMANQRNYWFVESLAEYCSALFMEYRYDRKRYEEHVESWREEVLAADMRSSVQNGYTEWQGPGGFAPYRAAIYAKGPYAFHIMRETWGDEAFFKFLKNTAKELNGQEIVTYDIQRVAEKTFGANLDWFFGQWLRGVGLPEYTFTYDVRETEDGKYLIEGEVSQRVFMKPAMENREELEGVYFTGIVPITVVAKNGKVYKKRIIFEGTQSAKFSFVVPEKPKEVVFNDGGESLSYDTVVRASN